MPKPPPSKRPPTPKLPKKKAPPPTASRTAPSKTYTVEAWTGDGQGQKILLYGESGMGKTTLASMLPNPIFIGVDDGGRRIRNPHTGEPIQVIMGVESFADILDVLSQPALFPIGSTLVLDTVTKAQNMAIEYVLNNYKDDRGQSVTSIEGFGYGKGHTFLAESMRRLESAADKLMDRGVNLCLIAQSSNAKTANAEGLDYIKEGPSLFQNNQVSVRNAFIEWADHVLRIGYQVSAVEGDDKRAKIGKVKTEDTTRVIFAKNARHYHAKSRDLPEPIFPFDTPDDDTVWQYMFETGDDNE